MDYQHGVTASAPTEQKAPMEELDTGFKRKYPPDQLGNELEDSASVWKVYRDEATAYDKTMIDGWSQTLDILLIFAGLFSAVATAFVVESYQQLQPDKDAFMLTALYIIASASNSSAAAALLPVPEPLNLEVSDLSRWINGLWFTSILLSLAVALLCILVKQWIGEYRARNNASVQSPRHWARRHEMYFQALNAWPVAELVSVLPVLLHIALFLFFAGAAAFLWTLDRTIGTWIVCMGALLTVFYLCCTLIPLWIPECPTSTPLVHQLRSRLMLLEDLPVRALTLGLSNVSENPRNLGAVVPPDLDMSPPIEAQIDVVVIPSTSYWRLAFQCIIRRLGHLYDPLAQAWISRLDSLVVSLARRTDEHLFLSARIEARKDDLDAAALRWLILSVSDSDAVAVGLQALGALDLSSQLGARLRAEPRLQRFTTSHVIVRSASGISPIETARVVRTLLAIRSPARPWLPDDPIWELLEDATYADASLCRAYMAWEDIAVDENVVAWHKMSSSVTSTALLLLHLHSTAFSRALELLLCCRLEQLQKSHWDLVIDLATEHGKYPRPIRTVRHSLVSTITCLLEILSQLVLCYPTPSRHEMDKSTAVKLITRLLSLMRVGDDDDSLSSHPFLLRYLAGSHTLAEDTDFDVVLWIIVGLRLAWSDGVTPALATLLWQAFAQTMNVAMSSATPFEELTLWEGPAFCIQGLYCAAEGPQRVDTPAYLLSECAQAKQRSTALKFMLSPTQTNAGQFDSMWSRFTRIVSDDSVGIWVQMTEQVVRTMNIERRHHHDANNDLEPASVDVFFSHLTFGVLKRLIAGRKPHAIDTDPIRIQHFLQHAIELCPQWWLHMLCDASHDCSSDMRKTYADMVRAPGTLPPCHDCSGVPLGWDLEFELEGEDAFIYPWHPIQ